MSNQIVTRFAPSPTGYLHIGGLRTALFSYLMARKNGGKFILRVEDTDQARLVKDSVNDIQESLKWAGINWDEGPIYQSERLEIYQEHAQKLLASGHGYKCFCTPDRLNKVREEKIARKENPGYDRHCRDLDAAAIKSHEDAGDSMVIRLKMPLEGTIVVDDVVRGKIETPAKQLEDIIVVKSDGFPTYHLAHVVDDTLMGVTHVFRGTEWIPTSPMHAFMFDAFGFKRLQYVHLPLILSPDGGKLSKRHGATNVKEFIETGYTKDGLINFLALLGWSLDDRTEFFTLADLEAVFDPKRISKSAATFSYDKLNHFNNHYIKEQPLEEFVKAATPFLNLENSALNEAQLSGLINLYRDRLDTISQLSDLLAFATVPSLPTPEKEAFVFPKTPAENTLKALQGVQEIFAKTDWDLDSINGAIDNFANEAGLKKHHIFMPLRMAVCGTKNTPSITDICYYLGKETCQQRIKLAIEVLAD